MANLANPGEPAQPVDNVMRGLTHRLVDDNGSAERRGVPPDLRLDLALFIRDGSHETAEDLCSESSPSSDIAWRAFAASNLPSLERRESAAATIDSASFSKN